MTSLYYEAHVTVDPLYGYKLEHFKLLCEKHNFRAAHLLMQKRELDTPERSKYDTFCTGRDNSLEELAFNLGALVEELQQNDIYVWRYKIEDTIVDSNVADIYRWLTDNNKNNNSERNNGRL